MMKVIQINLHHSKAASAALILRLHKTGEDLCLIQEPWTFNGRVCGLQINGYTMVAPDLGKPRSCILIKKTIKFIFLPRFSNSDNISIAIDMKGIFWVSSSYMAHDQYVEKASMKPKDHRTGSYIKKMFVALNMLYAKLKKPLGGPSVII